MKDISELFTIVEEPEHSQSQLITFENKYDMNTSEFVRKYEKYQLDKSNDFDKWYYEYEIFITANGDMKNINTLKY